MWLTRYTISYGLTNQIQPISVTQKHLNSVQAFKFKNETVACNHWLFVRRTNNLKFSEL